MRRTLGTRLTFSVVLGIAFFILGPMLGVFLIGMLTKSRGSEFGNAVAITAGLVTTSVLGGNGKFWTIAWLPKVTFTWFALIGAGVVFCVGALFKTPVERLASAATQAETASSEQDIPLEWR